MKSMLLVFLMMSSLSIFAQDENCDPTPNSVKPLVAVANAVKSSAACPNGDKLPDLCIAIDGRLKDKDGKFNFHYQRIVYEAACVNGSDSESEISTKVQRMWASFENRLVCNNTRFNVQEGNVLKFAVSSKFEDFLFDASMIWKVNLNKVDKSDDKTVLDYIRSEIERNKGTGIESKLKSYYDLLRSAGAKHKTELK